jgi:L-ascorbate metabolism protein UlaG (beta-lactamase superfamily)
MGIRFTWLGHSAFTVEVDGHAVLFDPFLTGNPLAAAEPADLNPELIFVSHGHGDHVGDTVDIAQRSGATVISNVEVAHWLSRKGAPHTAGQNTGGAADYGFCVAKFTQALHSSSLPDGSYGGNPNGFIVTARESGMRLYYAGDTALFSDMELIGDERIDVAFLPIGDYFTMGPADSIKAIKYLRPRFVAPMHYNTFTPIMQDAGGWANRVSNETSAVPIVIDPGGSFTLPHNG